MKQTQGVITSLYAIGFLARASYALARTPVLALFAAFLGAGPQGIGLVVGISTITGILFKMPAGVVADVIGKNRMLLISLAVFALVPFAYLWVSSYPALLVVRFFHGFATAIYGPVAMAVIVSIASDRRAERLSWFSSVTITGNLIGAPLGGLLLTQLSDGGNPQLSYFHIIYGVVAALGLISLLIGLVVLSKNLEQPVPQEKRTLKAVGEKFRTGIKEILMDRRVLLSSNMEGVQNLSMGALEAFLPIYAVQVCNFSPFQAGSLWAIQILTTVISKPLMGRWSDRQGRSPLLFGGMFACAIPFALIPWFQNYSILLILAAIFGLGEALVTSSAAALVADFCHQGNLGSAMGTFGTIFDIGHASGPILAGFLISRFGGEDFRLPFVIIAMILIISALAFKIGVKEAKINT